MDWAQVVVHWLHVLFATFWFGGHLARVFFVDPVLRTLPESAAAAFGESAYKRGMRLFPPVIALVGITGVLRGTVVGPIKSFDVLFGTAYGWTFIAAIAFGLVAFYPAKPAWLVRLQAEHIGFFGAFTAMILMHFGL